MKYKKIFLITITILTLFKISFAENFVTCDTPFSSPIINITDNTGNTQILFDDDSGNILFYKPINQIRFGANNKIYSSTKDKSTSSDLSGNGVLYTSKNNIKTLLFGSNSKIYSKNYNVYNGGQAWCPSDGWINKITNPYSSTPKGHYCINTYFEEDRDYVCNLGPNPKTTSNCDYNQINTYDCRLKLSEGQDKEPTIPGIVLDYETCTLNYGCTPIQYMDYKLNDNTIREYYKDGTNHGSVDINCKDYYSNKYYCDGFKNYIDSKDQWTIKKQDLCWNISSQAYDIPCGAAYCFDITGTFYDGSFEDCIQTLHDEVNGEDKLNFPSNDVAVYCNGYDKITKTVKCNGGNEKDGGETGTRCPITPSIDYCDSTLCGGYSQCSWASHGCGEYNSTTGTWSKTYWYKNYNCGSYYKDCDSSHVTGCQ